MIEIEPEHLTGYLHKASPTCCITFPDLRGQGNFNINILCTMLLLFLTVKSLSENDTVYNLTFFFSKSILIFLPLQVVYEDLTMVHLTSPYVPEYLAFREVGFLVDAISRLGKSKPELLPQVI